MIQDYKKQVEKIKDYKRQAEKVESNSSLYSDTKKVKIF